VEISADKVWENWERFEDSITPDMKRKEAGGP
jgi:hypothetical protein